MLRTQSDANYAENRLHHVSPAQTYVTVAIAVT